MHAPDVAAGGGDAARRSAQVPFKLIARRIADAEERRLVERMYDELLATGTVEKNLPEDDRMVRDLHAAEVLAKRPPQPAVSKVFPFKPREPASRAPRRPARRATRRGAAAANVVPLRAPRRAPAGAGQPTPPPAVAGSAAASRPTPR